MRDYRRSGRLPHSTAEANGRAVLNSVCTLRSSLLNSDDNYGDGTVASNKVKQPAKQQKKRIRLPKEHCEILRNRYGIPNWEMEDDYAYVKELSLNQVYWEFYRREKTYRDHWERGTKWDIHQKIDLGIGHIGVDELTPPYTWGTDVPKDWVLSEACRGLPIHPHINTAEGWPDMDDDELEKTYLQFGHELVEHYDAQNVIIGFSPFVSLEPQIANATRVLMEIRQSLGLEKQPPRTRSSDTHIQLLRVLDAYDEGITYKDIGTKVLGSTDYDVAASEAHHRHKVARTYRQWL